MAKSIHATSIDRLAPDPRTLKPYERLAAAVLLHACSDAQGSCYADLAHRLDACLWLAGPDARIFAEAAEINGDPLTLLTSGRLRR